MDPLEVAISDSAERSSDVPSLVLGADRPSRYLSLAIVWSEPVEGIPAVAAAAVAAAEARDLLLLGSAVSLRNLPSPNTPRSGRTVNVGAVGAGCSFDFVNCF